MKTPKTFSVGIGQQTNGLLAGLETRMMKLGIKPNRSTLARVAFQVLTDMPDEKLLECLRCELARRADIMEQQRTYFSRMAAELKKEDAQHLAEAMGRARADAAKAGAAAYDDDSNDDKRADDEHDPWAL